MTIRYTTAAILALYTLVGIFTFGHAWNGYEPMEHLPLAVHHQKQGAVALLGSMLWPLYWSIELQENKQ